MITFRIMGNFLSAFLRCGEAGGRVGGQVTYEEFIYSLPIPTLMTIFNMSQDLGIAMLETNPACIYYDRSLVRR